MAILQDIKGFYRFFSEEDSHFSGHHLTINGDATVADGVATFDGAGDYQVKIFQPGEDFQPGANDFVVSLHVQWDSDTAQMGLKRRI